MAKLRGEEDQIINMYKGGSRVAEIADRCKVHTVTIQRLLHRQKIPVIRGKYKPRKSNIKRVFSLELTAKMKENTRINNEHIQYIKFEHSTADQKLVDNLLNRPIIG